MRSRFPRWVLGAATIVAALGLGPVRSAHAQATGTIRGTVTDAGSQRPIADVQVGVSGTRLAAATNGDGRFTIANVPAGSHTITVRRIGYAPATRTVDVPAGGDVQVEIALTTAATQLDALVVTGTPGATEKRKLGNAVTQLDVAELTQKTNVTDVTEVLQSKTPGLTLLPGSGTPGTAAEIRIRGGGSISGTLNPVIYVDGIRYNSGQLGNFTPSGAGTTGFSGQITSALDFISPNDIESIEVIKGPAAATLYGADAAGGVIQIITKKGIRGQQGVRWTAKAELGQTDWAVNPPNNYAVCTAARIGNAQWPGCDGRSEGDILVGNPLRDDPLALRTGDVHRYSLSARGGGDTFSYFISGDRGEEEGTQFNSYNNRSSVRTNFTVAPSEKADVQVNFSYVRMDLRLPLGDEAGNGLILSGARGLPGFKPAESIPVGWRTIGPERANEYNNQTKTDRVTLGSTVTYRPWDWFTNRLTVGLDYTASKASIVSAPGSADSPIGISAERMPRTYYSTIDYAGSIARDLTEHLTSTTSFGTQVIANKTETLFAQGTGLGAPDVTTIGSAAETVGSNSFSENNSVGYYLQQEFGWNNRLFLTGAVRADDNSSFGKNFDLIVYPKAQLAWVLSEEPALAGAFDRIGLETLKLRAAYGQAGNAPAPYSATQTYTVSTVTLGQTSGSALRTGSFGNPDLKPETGEEIELGFDAGFLNGRLGAEFTYYDKTMSDAFLSLGVPGSTGFPVSRLVNLGKTANSGIELSVFGTPVQLDDFTWETRVNLATNKNELVSFGDTTFTRVSSGFQAYGTVQYHVEGYPLAGYWAQLPQRNDDGTPVLSSTGAVQLQPLSYIGPSTPTREVGFSNTFTFFQNFRLYTLLDYKGGHYLYNYRDYNRCRFQQNCWLAVDPAFMDNPERPVLLQVPAAYIDKADFVKLRDVSLTFSVPDAWIAPTGVTGANITLAGHNLALWSDYSGLDPEVNSYGNRGGFARADIYAPPMARRLTLSVTFNY